MNPRDTPEQPSTFPIGSFDAQRIEDALSLMGPKWTAWAAMTLAQEGRPMRVRDVTARLPFVSEQFVGKRLAACTLTGWSSEPTSAMGLHTDSARSASP
ncbi:hypothetical protein [Streptomyces sp. NPDC048001]|uniref:hypothetical protein n=1 Tax=Streptomyces sp. NPDC048001 TaxID=3365498 RepID=UPI00371D4933